MRLELQFLGRYHWIVAGIESADFCKSLLRFPATKLDKPQGCGRSVGGCGIWVMSAIPPRWVLRNLVGFRIQMIIVLSLPQLCSVVCSSDSDWNGIEIPSIVPVFRKVR